MDTRQCYTCKEIKPLYEFYLKNKLQMTRAYECKICKNARGAARRRAITAAKPKKVHAKSFIPQRRELVKAMKDKPCVDCGGTFPPVCMDFDHLAPKTKTFSIARWAHWTKWSEDDLKAEVAKCELVCANCHRIRTWR